MRRPPEGTAAWWNVDLITVTVKRFSGIEVDLDKERRLPPPVVEFKPVVPSDQLN